MADSAEASAAAPADVPAAAPAAEQAPAAAAGAGGVQVVDAAVKAISAAGLDLAEVQEALAAAAEANPDAEAAAWMKEQVEKEVARVIELGAKVLPVKVVRTGLTVEAAPAAPTVGKGSGRMRRKGVGGKVCRNLVEVDTSFDFDKVTQLLVSPAVPCPHKAGYQYVNLICMQSNEKLPPLLVGYLYDSKFPGASNDLSRFTFLNKDGKTSKHDVEFA